MSFAIGASAHFVLFLLWRVRARVCVCVCVGVLACMCVCVSERERDLLIILASSSVCPDDKFHDESERLASFSLRDTRGMCLMMRASSLLFQDNRVTFNAFDFLVICCGSHSQVVDLLRAGMQCKASLLAATPFHQGESRSSHVFLGSARSYSLESIWWHS